MKGLEEFYSMAGSINPNFFYDLNGLKKYKFYDLNNKKMIKNCVKVPMEIISTS